MKVIFHSNLPLFRKRLHICFVKADTAISPIYLASDEWKATSTDHAAPKISWGLIIFTLSRVLRTSVAIYHCNSLLVFFFSLHSHSYISSTCVYGW